MPKKLNFKWLLKWESLIDTVVSSSSFDPDTDLICSKKGPLRPNQITH